VVVARRTEEVAGLVADAAARVVRASAEGRPGVAVANCPAAVVASSPEVPPLVSLGRVRA